MEKTALPKIFAGSGRRFIAFFIDLIILNFCFAAIFTVTWLIKYDYVENWLIFFICWLIYFSLFDSKLFKGQTIGKKRLNIELINESGEHSSPLQAFVRGFYLAVLYFNFNLISIIEPYVFHNIPNYLILASLCGIISFLIFSTFIFSAFHPFHQTFYDALTKTFVVKKGTFNETELEKSFNISRLNAAYFLTFTLSGFCALAGFITGVISGK